MPATLPPDANGALHTSASRRARTRVPTRRAATPAPIEWDVETTATPLGWVAVAGCDGRVYSLAFGHATAAVAAAAIAKVAVDREQRNRPRFRPWHPTLAAQLVAYADGRRQGFQDIDIDLSHLTRFAARVIQVCRGIEWGETISYGELARRAGSPGAARAVGNVMAANRTPLIVPCHRVVAAHGKLGGFSAPQGTAMKQRLLSLEAAVRDA